MSQRLTQHFLEEGHYVCATDIRIDALKEQHKDTPYSNRLLCLQLNVCDPDEWKDVVNQVLTQWGHIDLHFNIAGVLFPHKIQDATDREINMQIDVNIKGVVFGTRIVALAMRQTKTKGHMQTFTSYS